MKLHRLELTGFGPFRERQVVDFDAFDGDGVFLITGRTGAGKSSILDGVSFALYGSVPRYDGGDRRLRSDHCHLDDPTEVRLEFTVGGARWRVTRAPDYERPAKRGGGVTVEPAHVEIEELVEGAWIGRAARAREAAHLLDEVLGLNAQQFQQVILLAQNKFSRFLLAGNNERQQLLRTLFGTRRFEQYKDDLDLRRREAQRSLDTAGERLATLLDLVEQRIDTADLNVDGDPDRPDDLTGRREAAARAERRAAYRAEVAAQGRRDADERATAAAAALADNVARARTLADLALARERMTQLDARTDEIAEDRKTLQSARAADVLRGTIETAERAANDLAAAERERERATSAWRAVAPDESASAADERITGELAVWSAALAQELALPADEAGLAAAAADIDRLTGERDELLAQGALVPAERQRIDDALRVARDLAAPREHHEQHLRELRDAHTAAEQAASLATTARAADIAYADASEVAAAAATALSDLLRRRLDGYAGELAAALVDGTPCAVCGSTTHPAPADHGAPITDDDIAVAEALRTRTAEAERAAEAAAREARSAAAAAAAAAGGRQPEELAAARDAAAAAVDRAVAAAADAERLAGERAELDDLAAAADTAREALTLQIAAAREAHAGQHAAVAARRDAVHAARGDFETVAARVAAAESLRDLARAALRADEQHGERRRAAETAEAERDERVAASPFDDVEQVVAAVRDAADRDELDQRLAAYDGDLAATRARLLDLELAAVDIDPATVDVAAAEAAHEAADAHRTEAVAAERDAVNLASELRDLIQQIDGAHTAVAVVADDVAAVTRLADTVAGRAPNTKKMDLETFVLAAELEEIVVAANLRLADMSSGRYSLHHSDARAARGAASGLGIDVLDAHTGLRRSPQSLSGGETFLASLALALGLAEVVTSRAGGIRLDTLFIDEGFGSLDPETLELAMHTLDELRTGGRTVGLISHVEAMKEQIPGQLTVEATPEGPSIVHQDDVAAR